MKKTAIYLFLFVVLGSSIAQKPVKLFEGIEINGIKQWVGATSKNDQNPLLLFLHGGPGFSSRKYSKRFVKELKRDFIVVQWDQRNTGLTAAWNGGTAEVSLSLMESDTEAVIDFLLKKFGKEKLYLVGFSWGNFLGLDYASKHPEKLYAYIAVSGIFNGSRSDSLTLNIIKNQAKATQKEDAIEELSKTTVPMESWEDLYYLRKWTAFFSGAISSPKAFPAALVRDWSDLWLSTFMEAAERDYMNEVPAMQCPVYFFVSKKDLLANYQVAEEYYNVITAPSKGIVWFEESAHEIPSDEPLRFSEEILQVKKKTEGAGM